MAEDSEDDGIEDAGMPPAVPGMRVWSEDQVAAAASAPPTADERQRFGIPAINLNDVSPTRGETRFPTLPARDTSIVEALVNKFPDFRSDWPEATQAAWFAAFSKLMDAGLR